MTEGKGSIVLGVTGSIAAYKAADLAGRLVKLGFAVDVLMTPAAQEFIAPLTFQSITHRPVVSDLFSLQPGMYIQHVSMAERASLLLVAPATATTIAKLAWGLADNVLTSTALATRAPILVAPAMNTGMWDNRATQENLTRLRDRGVTTIEPGEGNLACGSTGKGRMAEPEEIVDTVLWALGRCGDLSGRHFVITSGGTREPMDPVRYITNRSSGKMGLALALEARNRGASVTLVTASPPPLRPRGVEVVEAGTTQEMMDAVSRTLVGCDCLIMAAAPADYRVESPSLLKLKKAGESTRTLTLVANPDILATVKGPFVKVAFAAESNDLLENATRKLASKGAQLIVANDITAKGAGFEGDTNLVSIISETGSVEVLPLMTKADVAKAILDRVRPLLGAPERRVDEPSPR